MSHPLETVVSERAQHLFKTLVERYIRDGEPVSSRALSRESGLELSSASVRNVMADLEDLGMVRSPHTSAGRVPTVKGYRFFVDTLLTVQPMRSRDSLRLKQQFASEIGDSKSLLTSASTLLSGLTHLAGLVTLPNPGQASWRHIEFLPLSDNRALAILVINDGEVQNRVLQLDRRYGVDELQRAANYLNTHYTGKPIEQVRRTLLQEMQQARETMNRLMQDAIHMAEQALEPVPGAPSGYMLSGETNLMEFAELSSVDKLRRLFEAFNQKRDLLHLLDRCTTAEGVQVFIGEESGYQVLDECSVVTAPYKVNDDVMGVLGVIGPTRMAYERVIPIVDLTAKLLSAALNLRK